MGCRCGSASFRSASARHAGIELQYSECSGCGRVMAEQLYAHGQWCAAGDEARVAYRRWIDARDEPKPRPFPKPAYAPASKGASDEALTVNQSLSESAGHTSPENGFAVDRLIEWVESQIPKSKWRPYKRLFLGEHAIDGLLIHIDESLTIYAIPAFSIVCVGPDPIEVSLKALARLRGILGDGDSLAATTCVPAFTPSWGGGYSQALPICQEHDAHQIHEQPLVRENSVDPKTSRVPDPVNDQMDLFEL